MVKMLAFAACFVAAAATASAQVKDLTAISNAKERLEEYLSRANSDSDHRTVIFHITQGAKYKEPEMETLESNSGLWIADRKLRLNFSANEQVPDTGEGRRSITFFLNGKEKAKVYPLRGKKSSKFTTVIQPDPDTGGRGEVKESGFFGSGHPEIDPFGVPLVNAPGMVGRHTHIQNMTRTFTSKFKFLEQEERDGKLRARWVNSNKSYVSDMEFDDKAGGMPVSFQLYSVDDKLRKTGESVAETKTTWREVKEGHWAPESAHLTSKNSNIEKYCDVRFEFISRDQHNELVEKINWKELHDNDETKNWFEIVLEGCVKIKDEKTRDSRYR